MGVIGIKIQIAAQFLFVHELELNFKFLSKCSHVTAVNAVQFVLGEVRLNITLHEGVQTESVNMSYVTDIGYVHHICGLSLLLDGITHNTKHRDATR